MISTSGRIQRGCSWFTVSYANENLLAELGQGAVEAKSQQSAPVSPPEITLRVIWLSWWPPLASWLDSALEHPNLTRSFGIWSIRWWCVTMMIPRIHDNKECSVAYWALPRCSALFSSFTRPHDFISTVDTERWSSWGLWVTPSSIHILFMQYLWM